MVVVPAKAGIQYEVLRWSPMRAWLLHKPAPIETNPLVLSEVPDPKPGPGEVLLRVHACAICRTNVHVVEGDLQQRVSSITPGHQVIGEVTAIGAGVTLSTGERRGGGVAAADLSHLSFLSYRT